MITQLSIERFKSIKSLSIPCKKVNVFIGAPDTGKTNLLEVFYFLSRLGWNWPLDISFRIRQEMGFDALFYRQFFDEPIKTIMEFSAAFSQRFRQERVTMTAAIADGGQSLRLGFQPQNWNNVIRFGNNWHLSDLDWIRFYSYTRSEEWQYNPGYYHGDKLVNSPHGYNLLYIARHDSRVYEFL